MCMWAGLSCYFEIFLPDDDDKFLKVTMLITIEKKKKYGVYFRVSYTITMFSKYIS